MLPPPLSNSPILFRTVSTSFNHLDRLSLLSNSSLAPYVESLIFNEVCYNILQSARDTWPHSNYCPPLDRLAQYICDYPGLQPLDLTEEPRSCLEDPRVGQMGIVEPASEQEGNIDLVKQLVSNVLQVYKRRDEFQFSQEAFYELYTALRRFTNMEEVHVRHARDGEILKSVYGCKELDELNKYLPVSEGTFHMFFKSWNDPPQKGFQMMLVVLSALKRNVRLTVRHGDGLLRMGITLAAPEIVENNRSSDIEPTHKSGDSSQINDLDIVEGFSYLTKLDLKLTPWSDARRWHIGSSFLAMGIKKATQLHEISIGADQCFRVDLPALLPMFEKSMENVPNYPSLRTLRLDRFQFSLPGQLSTILRKQVPSLRHLSFVECVLEGGQWKDVLQGLSDDEAFTLDEFALERSQCEEDIEKKTLASRLAKLYHDTLVPRVVSRQVLTHFINSPGSENPLRSRKWRLFDHTAHEGMHVESGSAKRRLIDQHTHENADLPSDFAMHGIHYSFSDEEFEDMSDWEPEEQMEPGRDAEDEDTDGPEFDSEYDFSAEESSDDEMDIDVDTIRIAGVEMEMKTSVHVHRNKRERGLLPPRERTLE